MRSWKIEQKRSGIKSNAHISSGLIRKKKDTMSEMYSKLIRLYYHEMKSCREISRTLNIPEIQVRELLKKAKLQFMLQLTSGDRTA